MSGRVLLALLTYNERDNLEGLVEAIWHASPSLDVLVVDDHSPDGTGELADAIASRDARLTVIHRAGKLGLGTATMLALQEAVARDYEHAVTMDADFSHPPDVLPALLEAGATCDVAIGSRYIAGGRIVGWGWKRHVMSRTINAFARWAMRLPVRDASGAYRCYRTSLLRRVPWARVSSRGYSFQEEMLWWCKWRGARFREVPICFTDRVRGKSKINWREAVSAIPILLRLAARGFLGGPGEGGA